MPRTPHLLEVQLHPTHSSFQARFPDSLCMDSASHLQHNWRVCESGMGLVWPSPSSTSSPRCVPRRKQADLYGFIAEGSSVGDGVEVLRLEPDRWHVYFLVIARGRAAAIAGFPGFLCEGTDGFRPTWQGARLRGSQSR